MQKNKHYNYLKQAIHNHNKEKILKYLEKQA